MRFLTDALGLDPEKAAVEACAAEHVFSEETAAKIALLMKKPASKTGLRNWFLQHLTITPLK